MPPNSDRVPPSLRKVVAERAKERCEYCQCSEEFSPNSFTVDHIKPRQTGGETTAENLAWACSGCNGRKYIRTNHRDLETGQEAALFNPRQQAWSDHFNWNEDFTQVIGKTSCGRATLAALALNRSGIVNLRRLLVMAGLHPPK